MKSKNGGSTINTTQPLSTGLAKGTIFQRWGTILNCKEFLDWVRPILNLGGLRLFVDFSITLQSGAKSTKSSLRLKIVHSCWTICKGSIRGQARLSCSVENCLITSTQMCLKSSDTLNTSAWLPNRVWCLLRSRKVLVVSRSLSWCTKMRTVVTQSCKKSTCCSPLNSNPGSKVWNNRYKAWLNE